MRGPKATRIDYRGYTIIEGVNIIVVHQMIGDEYGPVIHEAVSIIEAKAYVDKLKLPSQP